MDSPRFCPRCLFLASFLSLPLVDEALQIFQWELVPSSKEIRTLRYVR